MESIRLRSAFLNLRPASLGSRSSDMSSSSLDGGGTCFLVTPRFRVASSSLDSSFYRGTVSSGFWRGGEEEANRRLGGRNCIFSFIDIGRCVLDNGNECISEYEGRAANARCLEGPRTCLRSSFRGQWPDSNSSSWAKAGLGLAAHHIVPMSEKQSPVLDGVRSKYVLVIHGGAGIITRENSTPEQQANYRKALIKSLKAVSGGQGSAQKIPTPVT